MSTTTAIVFLVLRLNLSMILLFPSSSSWGYRHGEVLLTELLILMKVIILFVTYILFNVGVELNVFTITQIY
jgi:hypothetical protein